MNGFMLLVRMTHDDMPIQFFANEADLRTWLRFGKGTIEECVADVVQRLKWPSSDLVALHSVEFRDGMPVAMQHLMKLN